MNDGEPLTNAEPILYRNARVDPDTGEIVAQRDDSLVETNNWVEYGDRYLKFREDTPYEVWSAVLSHLQWAEKSIHWWIGDALRFGERKWGEMYSQAVEETGFADKTLRNDVYVADRVELSRRRDNLSWSHHSEVAPLEPEEQEKLLDKAEGEGWSQKKLREEVKERKTRPAEGNGKLEKEGYREVEKMIACPHCSGEGYVVSKILVRREANGG